MDSYLCSGVHTLLSISSISSVKRATAFLLRERPQESDRTPGSYFSGFGLRNSRTNRTVISILGPNIFPSPLCHDRLFFQIQSGDVHNHHRINLLPCRFSSNARGGNANSWVGTTRRTLQRQPSTPYIRRKQQLLPPKNQCSTSPSRFSSARFPPLRRKKKNLWDYNLL
ncbi:hypothetical protein JTE90_016437 [Oedothorax gibbosus]|uniref:Uncharacterized protein n=1 Tax=Oedothorax gibbosus TaxID=931172 RepID=A0AAV6TDS7_9ARAC|nr:hypothetical protein JTE90_016437 [Oedothorax gibbosus]